MLALILILLVITTAAGQNQYPFDIIELQGSSCVIVQNGINVTGSCSTIDNCPSVLSKVLNNLYNHTLCGYEGTAQIVCCPSDRTQQEQVMKIDLNSDLECKLGNSNETGIIKFLSECPEINTDLQTNGDHLNKICDYEICADLVCCPVAMHKHRLKNVCSLVDHPIYTLQLRLLQNKQCTIKELNMTGVYQKSCQYAERNPHLAPLLQNVCNEYICQDWYCCPIEDDDPYECTKNDISKSVADFVGPKCIDSKSGRTGTCRYDFWNYGQSRRDIALDMCGTHCCYDYYCCPDDDNETIESVSAKACFSYSKHDHKELIEVPMDSDMNKTICRFQATPVVSGGIKTSPGDNPHMAALGYEVDKTILWNCGGSLISDRYVLTAAHCIINRIGQVKKVRLGVVNLLINVKTLDCPEEYDVAKQIPHPDYTPLFSYNDIGLVELDGRVTFNFHIQPICLPSSSDIPKHFISMGWGATGPKTDQKSATLLKVFQTLFSTKLCNELFRHYSLRKLNRGILNDTQICAGSVYSIQSTCNGDSGGPLMGPSLHNKYNAFEIYGIVSTGLACGFAKSPGIYTKVYPYISWIEGIVWSNYF